MTRCAGAVLVAVDVKTGISASSKVSVSCIGRHVRELPTSPTDDHMRVAPRLPTVTRLSDPGVSGDRPMGATTTSMTPTATTLRLCCELVASRRARGADPLLELRRPDVLDALARLQRPGQQLRIAAVVELWPAPVHDIHVLCASLRKTAHTLSTRGIAFDLWPQLDDDHRFLNTRTARVFSERLLPVLEALRDVDMGVFLDMEPSLSTLEGAWVMQNGSRLAEKARGLSRVVSGVFSSVWDARQGLRDLKELAKDTILCQYSFVSVCLAVLCLDISVDFYVKVKSKKGTYKLSLNSGIMRISGQDHVFDSAQCMFKYN